MSVLVIDNIDSFVYNLVQYIGEEGARPVVADNKTGLDEIGKIIEREGVDRVLISPGPKRPEDAGVSNDVIKEYGPEMPILGTCLGHQCIGHCYGGKIRRARTLMHGKASGIEHDGRGVLKGVPSPFNAVRYHSLVIDGKGLPDCLEVCATSLDDGEIMAVRHREHPVHGVQFHPESVLTGEGRRIVRNFLKL